MLTPGDTYYLDREVTGIFSGISYAAHGDPVRLISVHDVMVIVEGAGAPFPTRAEYLQRERSNPESLMKAAQPISTQLKAKPKKNKPVRGATPKRASLF